MRDVRIDTRGELRCWSCGSSNFREKRTARSKVLVGVGALATKKKLKCQVCGEYNDVGNAKPYSGPAKQRLGKKYGTLTHMHGEGQAQASAGAWHPDPHGAHRLRWWDGVRWTEHTAD